MAQVAVEVPAALVQPVCETVLLLYRAALEVLHQVTGLLAPATLGAAHIYDLRTMAVTREAVPQLPSCPVCG